MYAFEPCSIEFNDGYKIVYKSIDNIQYKKATYFPLNIVQIIRIKIYITINRRCIMKHIPINEKEDEIIIIMSSQVQIIIKIML